MRHLVLSSTKACRAPCHPLHSPHRGQQAPRQTAPLRQPCLLCWHRGPQGLDGGVGIVDCSTDLEGGPGDSQDRKECNLPAWVNQVRWIILDIAVGVLAGRVGHEAREGVLAEEPSRTRVVGARPQVVGAEDSILLLAGEAIGGCVRATGAAERPEDVVGVARREGAGPVGQPSRTA
jgi:hypothetical protein